MHDSWRLTDDSKAWAVTAVSSNPTLSVVFSDDKMWSLSILWYHRCDEHNYIGPGNDRWLYLFCSKVCWTMQCLHFDLQLARRGLHPWNYFSDIAPEIFKYVVIFTYCCRGRGACQSYVWFYCLSMSDLSEAMCISTCCIANHISKFKLSSLSRDNLILKLLIQSGKGNSTWNCPFSAPKLEYKALYDDTRAWL